MTATSWIVVGRFVRLIQELDFVRRFCTACRLRFKSSWTLRDEVGILRLTDT
jgi:hypothetical protein